MTSCLQLFTLENFILCAVRRFKLLWNFGLKSAFRGRVQITLTLRGEGGVSDIRMSSRWVSLDLVSLLVIQVCLGMRRPITRFYHGWCFGRGCQRLRKVRRAGGSHQKGPFLQQKGHLIQKGHLTQKGIFADWMGIFLNLKRHFFDWQGTFLT